MNAKAAADSIKSFATIAISILVILIGVGGVAIGSNILGSADRGLNNNQNATPFFVLAVLLVAVAVFPIGAFFWSADVHKRALREAESLLTSHCRTFESAVVYEGWYGTVHTFWFANEQYAYSFIQANAGKVLHA